jgi:uncharacterized protein (DUF305 family)
MSRGLSRRRLLGAAMLSTAPLAEAQTHRHPAAPVRGGSEFERYRRDMERAMERMMQAMHAPGSSGDADIDFLAMMIPHHQGAIDMARLLLIHGRDPGTRRLAEDIIAGQQVEIEGMTRRLATLRQRPEPEKFPELGGTRGGSN